MSFANGDVFLSRNTDLIGNNTPGYFNHSAIYTGNGIIIEAQIDPGYVIETDLDVFIAKYPIITVLRCDSEKIGNIAGIYARGLLGHPYRKIVSLFKHLRKRPENCVTVVRKAYKEALQEDPGWSLPDDILGSGLFKIVSKKTTEKEDEE